MKICYHSRLNNKKEQFVIELTKEDILENIYNASKSHSIDAEGIKGMMELFLKAINERSKEI